MTLKFNRVLEVVEVAYTCVQNSTELRAAVHELCCVEKKTRTQTVRPVATARTVINNRWHLNENQTRWKNLQQIL